MSTANKILMGASGGGPVGPSDDEFNRVSFLSHFDGDNDGVNNVFDDSSDSNHTITKNGDVTQGSFGPFARPDGEWGVTFNGLNDNYLTTPNSSDFAFGTGDFTIEFWFNPNHTDTGYILDSRANNVNGFYLRRTGTTGDLRFTTVNGTSFTNHDIDANTVNNNWYHFCVTRASAVAKFFLNGSQVGSDENDTSNITSTDLNIGASYAENLAYTGIISNLRIIKGTAVNPTELPTSPATNVTNTVLLTCQSNRFVDNSSSGHTVTPYGDVAVTAFGPFLTSAVYDAAVNGASAFFDGASDYLDANDGVTFGTGAFTIELFVNLRTLGSIQILFDARPDHISGLYPTLYLAANNTLKYFVNSGNEITSSETLSTHTWYHVAVCRSGTSTKMFLDGTQVGSTYSDSTNYSDSGLMRVGASGFDEGDNLYFDGYMSDVRVVNSALYTSNFTPPTAPLTNITNTKLLLNMADGQAIDSAAQNNLTLFADAKVSSTQSKFGDTSMYFDGTGDYALFPNTQFGTGDFTVECWVRCLGTTYDKSVWDNHTSSGSSDGLTLTRISEQQFRLFGTGELIRSGNFTITNTWVNVTVVRSSGTLNLFVNGVSQGTTTFTTNLNSSSDFVIGGGRYSGGPQTGSLNAYIDEFRISHMARYTSNFTPATEPFADKGQDA